MFKKSLATLFLALTCSVSANAEQVQSATASGPGVGRYLGTVLYNGSNTECTLFANPVMAVGPMFGLVSVGGALVNAYYYNCHELVQAQQPQISCPAYGTTINCMPPVFGPDARFCTPDTRTWVQQNCAGVVFID